MESSLPLLLFIGGLGELSRSSAAVMAAICEDMDVLRGVFNAARSCDVIPLPRFARPAGDGVVPEWGGVWFDAEETV